MEVEEAIERRRSVRQFSNRHVLPEVLQKLCEAGLKAPAPHHTTPWRFVVIEAPELRERLAEEMGRAWRCDLQKDGVSAPKVSNLLKESHRRITTAPGLILCGVVGEGLRDWPDARRRTFEWQMASHSMGAALQNIMLAAFDRGLASYWMSAPLYAPEAVRKALRLPKEFVAQASSPSAIRRSTTRPATALSSAARLTLRGFRRRRPAA